MPIKYAAGNLARLVSARARTGQFLRPLHDWGRKMNSWDDLAAAWQAAFGQAWEGYCAGSLPIGCVITNRDDQILFRGRNRLYETDADPGLIAGNHLAHAEINALARLRPENDEARQMVLYSTMEPCPTCTGAIRMFGIGAVHYAARDAMAGSISLLEATPFMRRAGITVTGPANPELENFSVALNVAAFLRNDPGSEFPVRMMSAWQPLLPDAVFLGQKIHDTGMLERLRAGGYGIDEVFEAVTSFSAPE